MYGRSVKVTLLKKGTKVRDTVLPVYVIEVYRTDSELMYRTLVPYHYQKTLDQIVDQYMVQQGVIMGKLTIFDTK